MVGTTIQPEHFKSNSTETFSFNLIDKLHEALEDSGFKKLAKSLGREKEKNELKLEKTLRTFLDDVKENSSNDKTDENVKEKDEENPVPDGKGERKTKANDSMKQEVDTKDDNVKPQESQTVLRTTTGDEPTTPSSSKKQKKRKSDKKSRRESTGEASKENGSSKKQKKKKENEKQTENGTNVDGNGESVDVTKNQTETPSKSKDSCDKDIAILDTKDKSEQTPSKINTKTSEESNDNDTTENDNNQLAQGTDSAKESRKRRRSSQGGSQRASPVPFKRIREDEVKFHGDKLRDNTFFSKADTYGLKAHNDLVVTRGKGFRKEKTKKKRQNHHGGTLNYEINSYKFSDNSE